MTSLRETAIRDALLGNLPPAMLNAEALQAVERLDPVSCQVHITDMEEDFLVEPRALERFCEAVIEGQLSADALRHIAFALIASDHFNWVDNLVAEVLHDWAAPEINYPLDPDNMRRFRKWLRREEPYPTKSATAR